jgi:choice-of-anchor B domain-containing protein
MRRTSRGIFGGLAIVLAGCGGGGSSPSAAPTPSPGGPSLNMTLLAHVELPVLMQTGRVPEVGASHDDHLAVTGPGGVSGSGNWGYTTADGRRFALTGTSGGLSIVEVTNPRQPRVVTHVPGGASQWREVRTYRQYVYITTEAKTGLDIVDMSNPDRPVKVRTWNETFTSAHTLWADAERGLLFVNGTSNGMRVLDLEPDPTNPREVGSWDAFYVHDSYARGETLYASSIYEGFLAILDVRDPGRIREITRFSTGGHFTHNSWLTRDGRYLFTTDERPDRPLEGWDIGDPMAPRKVSEYLARAGSIPHNVMIDGDRLLVSHYTDGVRLLDVRDPERPRVLGYYDTYTGTAEGFAGAWGSYIFPSSDLIVVSDISGGLFVVQYTGG